MLKEKQMGGFYDVTRNKIIRYDPNNSNTDHRQDHVIQLLIPRPSDYSFPSGHTAASFTAVAALYFAGEKKMWKIALILASLIAFSRLYLYVHYPTDILGGIIVGIVCGYFGMCCTKILLKNHFRLIS